MMDEQQRRELILTANLARQRAYCPYSNYPVGAALLTPAGGIYSGANVENVSYGLTICAERAAVCVAVSAGQREFSAIAVATEDGSPPCGACRQVLAEFRNLAKIDMAVYLVNAGQEDEVTETTLDALLPNHFGRRS